MVRLGATFATVKVAVSEALTTVFSLSCPVTVTTLVTVPALSTADACVKVKLSPGASTIGPVCPCAIQAALAAEVKSPRISSTTLVIVTGSVLAVLVLVIV